MTTTHKQVPNKVITLYLLVFFLWWSIFELSGIHFFASPLAQKLASSIIKFSTWTVPAFFLMKKYSDSLYLPLNSLVKTKFNFRPCALILLLMLGYVLVGSWLQKGQLQFNQSLNPYELIDTFFFVGITEEIVFRGWLLNALMVKTSKTKAILFSSFLFLFIHFPIWLKTDSFIQNLTSGAFFNVLVLSAIYSITFLKSKNILVPILLHMIWNLSVLLFFD